MPPKKPPFIPVPDPLGHTDHDNYYLCKRAVPVICTTGQPNTWLVRVIDDLCNLLLK